MNLLILPKVLVIFVSLRGLRGCVSWLVSDVCWCWLREFLSAMMDSKRDSSSLTTKIERRQKTAGFVTNNGTIKEKHTFASVFIFLKLHLSSKYVISLHIASDPKQNAGVTVNNDSPEIMTPPVIIYW